jgi:hypothetical protein
MADLTWVLVVQILGAVGSTGTTAPANPSASGNVNIWSGLIPPVKEFRIAIPGGADVCQAIVDANPDTEAECIATIVKPKSGGK